MHEGLVPDVSLGTHFFSELVESDMLYIAMIPSQEEFVLNSAFMDNAESEVPTVAELRGSLASKIDDYVATPGGRVWLNVPAEGLTYQVCGRGCVKADPKARPCKSFTPRIEYTLKQLQARAKKRINGC